jgi:hypothetical protein
VVVLNIAEWIANIFILGIAGLIWVFVVLGGMIIGALMHKTIKELVK